MDDEIIEHQIRKALRELAYKEGFKSGVIVTLLGVSILALVWWVGHQ